MVFGNVTNEPDGLSVTVNRRMTDGVTYAEFICLHGGGSLDGGIDIDIFLDRDRLDGGGPFGQPNFWTDGWQPGVDPQVFLRKVNAGNGRLHLEAIMFGRNASCGEPDDYGDPALMPGWQEMGGDSVLINGRPLNGALQMQPIQGQDPPPLQVVSLGGKSIGVGAVVRVTGALMLDFGHFRWWSDPFDPCGRGRRSPESGDRHPIYAIDVIDATPAGQSDRRVGRQSRHDLLREPGRRYGLVVWHGAIPQRQFRASFSGRDDERNDRGILAGRPPGDTELAGSRLSSPSTPGRMLLDAHFVRIAQRPTVDETL